MLQRQTYDSRMMDLDEFLAAILREMPEDDFDHGTQILGSDANFHSQPPIGAQFIGGDAGFHFQPLVGHQFAGGDANFHPQPPFATQTVRGDANFHPQPPIDAQIVREGRSFRCQPTIDFQSCPPEDPDSDTTNPWHQNGNLMEPHWYTGPHTFQGSAQSTDNYMTSERMEQAPCPRYVTGYPQPQGDTAHHGQSETQRSGFGHLELIVDSTQDQATWYSNQELDNWATQPNCMTPIP